MKNKIKLILLFSMCITSFLNAQSNKWWHTSGQLRTGIPLGGFNGDTATTGSLLFYNASTANTLTIQSGATSSTHTLTLPTAQGAASTVLMNNGSGALSWQTVAGIGAISGTCSSGANYIPKMSSTTAVTCSRIYDNGTNVGIGTASPSSALDIRGTTPSIRLEDNTDGRPAVITMNSSVFTLWSAGASASVGEFKFLTGSGSGTERVRITGAGNVGIGIASPAQLLHLEGTVTSSNGIRQRIRNLSNNSATYSVLEIGNDVTANLGLFFVTSSNNTAYGGTNSLNILNNTNNPLTLGTNSAVRMTILGNGDVGIGTTSPTKRLHVNGDSYFDGDVEITGTGTIPGGSWTASDEIFKTNIDSLQNALSIIHQLKPKSYYFDTTNVYGFHFLDKKSYGFLAQDLNQILPELVKSTFKHEVVDTLGNVVHPEITFKSVNYDAFIGILTKGIQELEFKNDNLQSKVNNQDSVNFALQETNVALQNQINNLVANGNLVQNQLNQLLDKVNNCCNAPTRSMQIGSSELLEQTDVKLSDVQSVVLEQNVPNPFAEQTTINYTLPENTTKAQMLFYNSQGKLIQSTELTQKGSGQLNVFASDLSNGIYTYTLVVDGRIVDSKKMIRNK